MKMFPTSASKWLTGVEALFLLEPLKQVLDHTRRTVRLLSHRALVLMGALEHIHMTAISCRFTSNLIPRAVILLGVFEHIKMTLLSCCCTSPLVPRAALASEPLQYLQVTPPRRTSAYPM